MIGTALPDERDKLVKMLFQMSVSFFSCIWSNVSEVKLRVKQTYVGASARAVDGQNTDIVRSQTPYGQRTAKRGDAFIATLQHTVHCESVLLLTSGFTFDVRDTRREVLIVDCLAFTLAVVDFTTQQLLLIGEPLRDLGATEGELTSTVLEVQDGSGVL